MKVQGLCHVSRADGTWSARSPKPVTLRSNSCCGLGLKPASSRHHHDLVNAAAMAPSADRFLGSSIVCRASTGNTAESESLSSVAKSTGSAHHRIGTDAVHAGERSGRPSVRDSLTTPIVQTSTYWFENTQQVIDFNEGRYQCYEYGRYGNPTVDATEEKIRALEEAEDCLLSASGMNSVTSMLLSLVPASGHIVTTSDCYWRTRWVRESRGFDRR